MWVLDISKNHSYLAYVRLYTSLCNMLVASVWMSCSSRSPIEFRDNMIVEVTCKLSFYINRGYQHKFYFSIFTFSSLCSLVVFALVSLHKRCKV